jgi:hypothetical protein
VNTRTEPTGLAARLPRAFDRLLRPLLDRACKRWLLLGGILAALALSVSLAGAQLGMAWC